MKTKLLVFSLCCFAAPLFSQCPSTPIILESQADVDNFSSNYPGCTMLLEELRVDGNANVITNLNGLSGITNAQKILLLSTQIVDFNGLHNLETVSRLAVWGNNLIDDLEGLSALQSIGTLELYVNNGLLNLSGAPNLQALESINMFNNHALADLSQLSFLTTLNDLVISDTALTSLAGLENIHTIQGDILLSYLPVDNLNELSSLTTFNGSLYITNNPQLQDISAFGQITEVQDLYLLECPNLSSLSGLGNIQTVNETLRIGLMDQLVDTSIFSNLTYVKNLDIYENSNLQSLSGLENLQVIDQTLHLLTNPLLADIESLNNVSTAQISEVIMSYNTSLSICTNDFICAAVNDGSILKFIVDNETGCSSVIEIQEACLLNTDEISHTNAVFLYPNPVSNILSVMPSQGIELNRINVFTMLGQNLLETQENVIDFSAFATGTYFVEVITNQGSLTKKIVKR